MKRLTVIVGLMLIASACSSGSEATTTIDAASPVTTTAASETTTSLSTDTAAESASCVGTWQLDSAGFFDMYNEIAAATEQISFVSGEYIVTWNADGTFTDERVDWTFEFPGIEGSGAMIMNSAGAGQWQLDDGDTIVTGYELTDPELSMIIDGEVVDLPVAPGSLPSGLFDDRATVTCTDTTMSTSAGGYESVLIRVG